MSNESFPQTPGLGPGKASDEAAAEAQWFAVIDGEVNGPLSVEQMSVMVRHGMLLSTNLAWREGMAEWADLSKVPEFAALFDRKNPPRATSFAPASKPFDELRKTGHASSTSSPAALDSLGGPPTMRKAPIGFDSETENPTGERPTPERAKSDTSRPRTEPAALSAVPYRYPDASADHVSEGEMQSLAGLVGTAASGTTGKAYTEPGSTDGYARGGGSGLIDLTILTVGPGAAAHFEGEESLARPRRTPRPASIENVIDSLAPTELTTIAQQKNPIVMAALGGVAIMVVSAVAVTVIIGQKQPTDSLTTAATAPTVALAPPALSELQKPTVDKDEAPAVKSKPARKRKMRTEAFARRARREAAKREAKSTVASATVTESTAKRKASVTSEDYLDELLNSAVRGRKKKPAAVKKSLPKQPSRDRVLSVLRRVTPAVRACAKGSRGRAVAAISVAGSSGKVSSAKVIGVKPAIGRCMSRAIKGARFPRFSRRSFEIKYPFRL